MHRYFQISSSYNRIAGQSLARLSGLSDGIFGVAMTLLVFDFRPPDGDGITTEADLGRAALKLVPQLTLIAMSFLTLGIFWVGQHTQLEHLARSDRHFVWIHIGFLFLVSLVPFSTRLLIGFLEFRLATVMYWLNNVLIAAALYGSWHYAQRRGLIKEDLDPEVDSAIRSRILISQVLYAIGVSLCVFHTYYSIGFLVIVQLGYAFGLDFRSRWLRRAVRAANRTRSGVVEKT